MTKHDNERFLWVLVEYWSLTKKKNDEIVQGAHWRNVLVNVYVE